MFLYFRLIVMPLLQMREQVDDEENDDEDMGVAETYSDYMPPKCKLLSGFLVVDVSYTVLVQTSKFGLSRVTCVNLDLLITILLGFPITYVFSYTTKDSC